MKITVTWDIVLCSLIEIIGVSEVLTASIIRCSIPEDNYLHWHLFFGRIVVLAF
jgi:hypothetical protein